MWTNCYHLYPAHAAFGGYKKSGIGRENHKMMLDHYQQTKNMLVSYSPTRRSASSELTRKQSGGPDFVGASAAPTKSRFARRFKQKRRLASQRTGFFSRARSAADPAGRTWNLAEQGLRSCRPPLPRNTNSAQLKIAQLQIHHRGHQRIVEGVVLIQRRQVEIAQDRQK